MTAPKFPLGNKVVTSAALLALIASGQSSYDLFNLHASGDHGNIPTEESASTYTVLSSYTLSNGVDVMVVTEFDHGRTTLSLYQES